MSIEILEKFADSAAKHNLEVSVCRTSTGTATAQKVLLGIVHQVPPATPQDGQHKMLKKASVVACRHQSL